jgi:hypothetical protein
MRKKQLLAEVRRRGFQIADDGQHNQHLAVSDGASQ